MSPEIGMMMKMKRMRNMMRREITRGGGLFESAGEEAPTSVLRSLHAPTDPDATCSEFIPLIVQPYVVY